MMDLSISDFIKWYKEGDYDTDDPLVIRIATNSDVNRQMYKNNKVYRNCLISWMDDIYRVVSGITNQFIINNFFIRTNCAEKYNKVFSKQNRLLLIPYDNRFEKYRMEIRVDDSGENREFFLIDDNISRFRDETGLLEAINGIRPKGNPITYRIRLAFLWDDSNDVKDVMLTVPGDIPVKTIKQTIREKHIQMDNSGDYDEAGRSPETLLNEVCRGNGWTWEEERFDFVVELD